MSTNANLDSVTLTARFGGGSAMGMFMTIITTTAPPGNGG
jgi:hypothetical protein